MNYCFSHAMKEISMIEYFDPNRKLGKFIFRIPTKEKKYKCVGAIGQEPPCKKWGIFYVGLVTKKTASKEYRKILREGM